MNAPRLVLRTCNADMSSSRGFVWPRSGKVTCPDWDPAPECGHGLHGLLNGQGVASLLNWSPDAVWLVVKPGRLLVDLGGEVKFKTGTVIFAGDRAGALAVLRAAGVTDALPGDVVTAGDSGTATAGDFSTATAGDSGTATAGDSGTATAGYFGTATAGRHGTATAGDFSTATAGRHGTATAGHSGTATAGRHGTATAGDFRTATAGDFGTATAGDFGTATAGDYGTATAGHSGTATAGRHGTATAGRYGTATAGYSGTLVLKWRDGHRYRLAVAYVGENGIKPDTPYRLDDAGRFVEVTP